MMGRRRRADAEENIEPTPVIDDEELDAALDEADEVDEFDEDDVAGGGYMPPWRDPGYRGRGRYMPHRREPERAPPWTTKPAIAQALPEGAVQFRVQFIDEGRPRELGEISKDATIYEYIAKFGKAGRFHNMPIDMLGKALLDDPIPIDIHPDHEAFVKAHGDAGGNGANGHGGTDPVILEMLRAQMLTAQRQAEAAREEARLEREERIAREREANEKTTAMANDVTRVLIETQETLMTAAQERNQTAMTQLLSMMNAGQQQQQRAHEQAMEREKAAAAAERERLKAEQQIERERHERWMAQQKAEADERRAREDREREEREARRRENDKLDREERARRDKERQEMLDRQMQNQQAHQALIVSTLKDRSEASNPVNWIGQLSTMAAALKELGIDVPSMLGGGPTDWKGLLASTVTEGIKGLVELQKIQATMVDDDDDDDDPMLNVQMGDKVVQMRASQYEELQARVLAQQQLEAGATAPAGDVETAEEAPSGHGSVAQTRDEEVKALPVDVRKRARVALRDLVSRLTAEGDREKWGAMVVDAITTNLEIVVYVRARAIYPAIIEAGATPGTASAIMSAIEATGQVPADIPRT